MVTFGLVLLALVVGVLGFIPLLPVVFVGPVSISEWGPANYGELALTLVIYLISGAAIGFLKPRAWLISSFLAWLCIFGSLSNLALVPSNPGVQKAIPLAVVVLVLPLGFALSGGYVGHRWRRHLRLTSAG